MKNFYREHPQFSQCGLNCLLCPMCLGGYCPGCGGGEGNQSCAIARCAGARDIGEFCTQCPQFPCARYEKMTEYDSFVPHSKMVFDLERASQLGLEAYITQLEERRAALDRLLADWNDGRRKSLYCLAAWLLEPEELHGVLATLEAAGAQTWPLKDRAAAAAEALKSAAENRGIVLKLNKKPREK